jgi:DNA-3-methyladenine glycosylase II
MTENKMLQLTENDAILKSIISTIPEPQFRSTNNVFHDLMSCILEQQIHYRSTKKVFQKMLNTASLEILTPENFSQFEEKAFSNIKLSTEKYETLLRIIEFWNGNKINFHELKDEEIISTLSSIKGIGKWTIDMILLYTLQRPNVFPCDDFHLKEIMIKLYSLDPNVKLKAQMIDVSNAWEEHKSLAVKYLLAWKEFNKKNE